MPNAAGPSRPLQRLATGLSTPELQRAIRVLEDKIVELDARVKDLERRAAAGGI